jgi:hypothetical protein
MDASKPDAKLVELPRYLGARPLPLRNACKRLLISAFPATRNNCPIT